MAAQRKVSIKTPLPAEKLLVRAATVVERLGQPFELEIDLLSPDESLDFDSLLGKELTLTLELDHGSRHFHAFLAGFSQLGRLGRYVTYRARAVPWLWFLTRTSDCFIFQNQSAPDIIKEVFRQHGFTDIKDSLSKTYRVREYCVQYRETDFNFVQRLMEEEGIYYYFKHTESTHTLVLADAYSAHQAYDGYGSIEYFPYSDNVQREADHIHDWHLARNIQPGKYVVTDYDFTKPRASLKTQFVQQRSVPKSDFEMYDYPGNYVNVGDGDHYAQARLEGFQAAYETVRGLGNARGLAVGSLFKLTGYPRQDQNREYLVVSATHRLDAGELESGTGARQQDYTCSFEAIDAKQPYRSAPTAFKTRVSGPQTAMVVGPAGEEIYTDKYARVKVKFHWDRDPKRDENSSCWVRVSQIWAGKGWGQVSIPRIGQEVVVDFLEGDPDQPLVVGRVYNQDNMPPYALPGAGVVSGLKSQTHKGSGYNEMSMDDTAGKEKITVHGQYDMNTTVEHDQTNTVNNDSTETIKNNAKIEITKGTYNHDVKTGTATYHVQAALTENYDATQTTTVKSNISTTSSTGSVYVQAATHIHLQVGLSTVFMDASGQISITGKNIAIHGSESVSVSGAAIRSVAEKEHETKGKIVTSDGATSNTVRGAMVMLNP
jgi:type VI secretion system secreted protein VgrG